VAGYTWNDVCSERLPFDQFVALICHAPPGTAVYHEVHEGWTVADHLLTDLIEVNDWLLWTKSADAQQKTPRKKPKPRPRPGAKKKTKTKADEKSMTVAEYMAKTGMAMTVEGDQ
jgi:D-alanyl-D-alanine carboxypeptidase